MLCLYYNLLILFITSCLPSNAENSATNNSLFSDNELWTGLIQNCGQRSAFTCVQSNIYGYIDKSMNSDFYLTDSFIFKKNKNKYLEYSNDILDDSVNSREAKSRWNKLNESFDKRTGVRQLDENENDVGTEDSAEKPYVEKDIEIVEKLKKVEEEEAQSFTEFVDAVEEAEKTHEKNYFENNLNNTDSANDNEDQISEVPKNRSKSITDITDMLYNRGVNYLMTHDLEMHLPQFVFGGAKVSIQPRSIESDGGAVFKLNIEPHEKPEGRIFFKHIRKLFHKKLMSSMLAAMLIIKLLKVKLMFLLPVLLGVGTAKKILLKVLLFIFPALAHLFKLCSYYHHHATKYHHHHHQVAHHHHHVPVPVHVSSHTPYSEYGPPPSYEISGPGDYIHSRTDNPFTNELVSWGLGEFPASWDKNPVTPAESVKSVSYPPHRPPPGGFQYPDNDVKSPTFVHRNQYNAAINPGINSIPSGIGSAPNRSPTNYPKASINQAVASRLHAITPKPTLIYDPFYSPILTRIDAIFNGLGVQDEGCRERLVCSIYKNPMKYSPHSNLLSAELSKEPNELQKPTTMNPAVLRFFKYMQAARDGQEFKECLRIYPLCSLNTEL